MTVRREQFVLVLDGISADRAGVSVRCTFLGVHPRIATPFPGDTPPLLDLVRITEVPGPGSHQLAAWLEDDSAITRARPTGNGGSRHGELRREQMTFVSPGDVQRLHEPRIVVSCEALGLAPQVINLPIAHLREAAARSHSWEQLYAGAPPLTRPLGESGHQFSWTPQVEHIDADGVRHILTSASGGPVGTLTGAVKENDAQRFTPDMMVIPGELAQGHELVLSGAGFVTVLNRFRIDRRCIHARMSVFIDPSVPNHGPEAPTDMLRGLPNPGSPLMAIWLTTSAGDTVVPMLGIGGSTGREIILPYDVSQPGSPQITMSWTSREAPPVSLEIPGELLQEAAGRARYWPDIHGDRD